VPQKDHPPVIPPSFRSTSVSPDIARNGLADVILAVEAALPSMTNGEVYNRFTDDPELVSIPVVEKGRPVGLVYRHELTMRLAHRYGNALYANKPVSHLMDAEPLVVEHLMNIDDLEWIIANEKPSALLHGFIVTRNGAYVGVASALSLLRVSMARTERRNQELEEARRRAEVANDAKSRFLTIMSHELRTPLNAIIGFTDLMRSQTFGAIEPPRYGGYLKDINDAAYQLLANINDVLDMAKIEQGKMVLFEEPLDIKETVHAVVRLFTERAQAANISLNSELPTDRVVIRADHRAVRHILFNLLSNAIKFTPPEGDIAVRVVALPEGGIELAVADTGIGMSPEHVETALTPFAQIENSYTRKYEGTGLGLPLVKSLVELHGGTLKICSSLGAGTTVRIGFQNDRVIEATSPLRVSEGKG
jgi:two-component system cell cycle sensor histidine kinase PleC